MIIRFFRHILTTRASGKHAFPTASLEAIENRIAQGEKTHRAEVRVIIEPAMPVNAILDRMTPRERALELFGRYGIWDTQENNGILVYINLADRQVDIIADRGIAAKVGETEWQNICAIMTFGFAQGHFQESTLTALSAINTLLQQHFPAAGTRENVLPDRPILL